MQKKHSSGCQLRIDPILVNKFKRLPGGINEAGIKIIRDVGLRYNYDKKTDIFDIIGDDLDILHIAIETLRFWVEEDDYPSTGITCQVGYPNKGIVIWRFHGDYGKKFNHLFSDDIAKLKGIPSLYVKAVPTKRNPEYVEVFCNFLVYQQVKWAIQKITAELEKICQTDFFVPRSDFNKARAFARSKARDEKVLYALKEYPENNTARVWIFARDNQEILKAKKKWIQHIGMIARNNELVKEDTAFGVDMNSLVFIEHPSSALTSERSSPKSRQNPDCQHHADKQQGGFGFHAKSDSTRKRTRDLLKTSPRAPTVDNSNFPRPHNFVYPISLDETDKEFYKLSQETEMVNNPFNLDNPDSLSTLDENGKTSLNAIAVNPMAGEAKWVREDEIVKTRRKVPAKPGTNRIYVHLQVDAASKGQRFGPAGGNPVKVVHTEKNLIPGSKLNARNVITSVTDSTLAPGVRKRGKNVRPGGKKVMKKLVKIDATARVLKPALKDQMPVTSVRYQIKVNGLAIYMYRHFIVKLDHMDALVNAVSTSLKSGGLIAKSMFDHAGENVTDEVDIYLKMNGNLKMGDNLVTSAGRIPALGIIHVAAPVWEVYTNISEEECVTDLHKTIYNALKTAEKHQYRKVGIPVISSEPYFGVPRQIVADVYVKALVDYSLAMGPLYPILEIHIVDLDVEMLNLIKESYEKWASSPAYASMKSEFDSRKESMTNATQLSRRAESAVSLKGVRSHKSQNMVTFMEQSYTAEGNQVWTFEVLTNLLVHVYTGTLLNVDGVDGLVCGMDTSMRGALAKLFLSHGGSAYENALMKARGKKDLTEGDVIVSDGGNLNTDLVLHSIVESPIYRVSRKNLARLDNINNEVLHTANRMGITSLALPLIGTARLREAFEIEQCSLQLVDNIIEFSLSMEKNLRIRELHLVNVSSITTQSLTQALRTRAHTKLRVEVPSRPPSRQDVLSTADPNNAMTHLHIHPQDGPSITEANMGPDNTNEDNLLSSRNEGIGGVKRNSHVQARRGVVYLSEKNLKEHEKTMKDKDSQHPDEEGPLEMPINDIVKGKARDDSKIEPIIENLKRRPIILKRDVLVEQQTAMENRLAVPPYLPKLELGEVQKFQEGMKTKRVKQKTPTRGPIMQKSRAESYREIHIRKQSIIQQRREELSRLRRSYSVDNDIFSNENAEKVYEMFKTERNKLNTLRATNIRLGSGDYDLEALMRKHSNYFTRGTRERYRVNAGHNIDDKDFEMTYKLHPDTTINDTIAQPIPDVNGTTTKREPHVLAHADRNMNSRFNMADRKKEREEMYMMDMSFGKIEAKGFRKAWQNDNEEMEKSKQKHIAGHKSVALTDRSEKSRTLRKQRYENMTEANAKLNNNEEEDEDGNKIITENTERLNALGPDVLSVDPTALDVEGGESNVYPINNTAMDSQHARRDDDYVDDRISEENSRLLEQLDQYVSETDYPNKAHIDAIAASFDQFVSGPAPDKKPSDNKITNIKSNKGTPRNAGKQPAKTSRLSKGQKANGRIANNQTNNGLKKTPIDSKQSTKENVPNMRMEPYSTNTPNDEPIHVEMYPAMPIAPRPEDVTIRDKLTLEIDVVNKKKIESKNITKEKKKIQRFWQVVDDSKELDDTDIYGEDDNEKVVVAKVKKERRMSAKSKMSKSNISTVTQPLGKYNVTVEVA